MSSDTLGTSSLLSPHVCHGWETLLWGKSYLIWRRRTRGHHTQLRVPVFLTQSRHDCHCNVLLLSPSLCMRRVCAHRDYYFFLIGPISQQTKLQLKLKTKISAYQKLLNRTFAKNSSFRNNDSYLCICLDNPGKSEFFQKKIYILYVFRKVAISQLYNCFLSVSPISLPNLIRERQG